MIKLLTLWAAWRLLRAIAVLLVVATVALVLLRGVTRSPAHRGNVIASLRHTTQPLERQLERTLQKAFGP